MSLGNSFKRTVSGLFGGAASGELDEPVSNGNGGEHAALDTAKEGRVRAKSIPTCVEDIMTTTVVTLSPQQSFGEALALMANRPFRHILVVEHDTRLVGVISDRDLLRVLSRGREWKNITVGDVMTRDTVTVRPETALSIAVGEVLAHRINCLPVLSGDGRLCGIVTSTDLLDAFHRLQASLERVTREEAT